MTTKTPAPAPTGAPAPPVVPSATDLPPAPDTLKEWRSQHAAKPVVETPPPPPPAAVVEPPDGEGEDVDPEATPPEPVAPKGPEAAAHRWKDPDTNVTLDLRRRDHRRIKRLLEERSDYARRLAAPVPAAPVPAAPAAEPVAEPRAPVAVRPDPRDPEPTLEQFADQPDPYGAYTVAAARWHARQEFRTQSAAHSRVERMQQATAAIATAQEAFDAGLPTARAQYPEFDAAHAEVLDTLSRVPLPIRAPLVHRLLTSPVRYDLTHHFGSHPDDLAAVLDARTPYEQGMAIGAIETRVRGLVNQRTAPAPIPVAATPPPAPMAPVGGTASPVALPDGAQMNLAQFRASKRKLGMAS